MCSLSHTTCGKTESSDDSAAPAPSATSNVGMAQQTSVLELANKLAIDDQKLPLDYALPSVFGCLLRCLLSCLLECMFTCVLAVRP